MVNSGALEDHSETEIVDIYEPEADDLQNGVTFEDLPDKKTKIRKTVSTNYEKIAKAIGDIRSKNISVSLIDINKSDFSFKPDVQNNQILFGLKGMLNINDELIQDIISNRPYASPKDFLLKVAPKKQAMISLIKGGAFDKMLDRQICMGWYLWEVCGKKEKLTLQNMPSLIKYNLLPEDLTLSKRVYEFNRYLKSICKYDNINYKLDERAINFLIEIEEEDYITSDLLLNIKTWDKKVYQKYMDNIRQWLSKNHEKVLSALNKILFKEEWDRYASGNLSAWEMEVLCFYYHEHELQNINKNKYGIANFFNLSENPAVERSFTSKSGHDVKIFKLHKICGTCIAKNKAKSSVSLLTPEGVVNVKFRKEYFALFDKQISEQQPDGSKKIVEKSWFNRGKMIIVQGIRSGDDFLAKKYSSSSGHTLYLIDKVYENGDVDLIDQRYKESEE